MPLHLHPRRYDIMRFDAWAYMFGNERLAATLLVRDDLQHWLPIPEEFNNAADSLRKLAKSRVSAEDLKWRTAMGEACAIAFVEEIDPKKRARFILRRAASVNETDFAMVAILPEMLGTDRVGTARFLAELYSQGDESLPDLFLNFSPKTN